MGWGKWWRTSPRKLAYAYSGVGGSIKRVYRRDWRDPYKQKEGLNTGLSDRSNKGKLNKRIPDIYGTIVTAPDLLKQSYTYYVDDKQAERSFMCIGRGKYEISDI